MKLILSLVVAVVGVGGLRWLYIHFVAKCWAVEWLSAVDGWKHLRGNALFHSLPAAKRIVAARQKRAPLDHFRIVRARTK